MARASKKPTGEAPKARARAGGPKAGAARKTAARSPAASRAGEELREHAEAVGRLVADLRGRLDEFDREARDLHAQLATLRDELREARREVGEFRQHLRRTPERDIREALEVIRQRTELLHKPADEAPVRSADLDPKPVEDGRNRLGVTVTPGVVVAEVEPGSPAAAAGVAAGDVIDGVNGRPVRTGAELRDVVRSLPEGEEAVLRVTRGGVPGEVRVRLEPLGSNGDPAEGRNRIGVTVEPGVVVAEVLPETPAAAAGLAPGDVITAVNGEAVHGGDQLRAAVRLLLERAEVRLDVSRGGESREVRVRLDEPIAGE